MKQKKNIQHEEILRKGTGRELMESELALVSGGSKGSFHWPGLPDLLAGQDKPSAAASGKNATLGNLPGLDGLAGLTNGLLGSLAPQPYMSHP